MCTVFYEDENINSKDQERVKFHPALLVYSRRHKSTHFYTHDAKIPLISNVISFWRSTKRLDPPSHYFLTLLRPKKYHK